MVIILNHVCTRSLLIQYLSNDWNILLLSSDGGSQNPLGELFEDWCAGLFTLPISLPWTKFGKALQARQELLKFFNSRRY